VLATEAPHVERSPGFSSAREDGSSAHLVQVVQGYGVQPNGSLRVPSGDQDTELPAYGAI
jgi:hypothetical protein